MQSQRIAGLIAFGSFQLGEPGPRKHRNLGWLKSWVLSPLKSFARRPREDWDCLLLIIRG